MAPDTPQNGQLQRPRTRRRRQRQRLRQRQRQDRARHVLLLTAATIASSQCSTSAGIGIAPPLGGAGGGPGARAVVVAAFAPAHVRRKESSRHSRATHVFSSANSLLADLPKAETTDSSNAAGDETNADTTTNACSPQPNANANANANLLPTIHPDLISQTITNSVKQRGSESYRRSYNKWSSTALQRIRSQLAAGLPVAPDADATARLGFELGVAADRGRMPSFADGGARAGYALDYFCRAKLLGDVLFGQRMNGWRYQQQTNTNKEHGQDQSSQAAAEPSYLGDTVTDLLGSPNREVCRIGSLGGGPGFDHVAAAVLATHAALEREVRYCIDTHAEASFRVVDGEEEECDGLPRLDVEDVLSHLSSRSTSPMPRIETTVYEYEKGWDDIIPHMEESTQSVLDLGRHARHSCQFAGCDITVPLTHPANAECLRQAQTTDLWICSYCVAENAIRLRANNYIFFAELFDAAPEGAVFIFTETTHRLWPEIIDVATKANNAKDDKDAARGFDVAFPRIQRGRGKAGFQLALRRRSGATLGEEVKATCDRFRRDNAMHELKISGGYKRQKRKIRGAK